MRFPLRNGVLRSPIRSISHRAFSTTCLANRQQNKKYEHPRGESWTSRPPRFDSAKEERKDGRSRANSVGQGHDPKSRLRLDNNNNIRRQGRHGLFRSTVFLRFQEVLDNLNLQNGMLAGIGEDEVHRQAELFMDALDQSFELAERGVTGRNPNPLFWSLRDAFILKDVKGLTNEIRYSFQSFLIRQRFSKGMEQTHKRMLDFRYPHEWFPATRTLQRTIHVHVGPTNSGKTYNALKALENSKRGVYAGPLRLLATEIYQRLTAKGLPCALLTGEEVRIPENTDRYFNSCTVEMTPLNEPFDVAVIDEIQMISDPSRGNAWTAALLGVQAKEVHVCGEERTVKLIKSLCASIGDECIIHRYERLSPLQTMNSAIDGDYGKLEKGDCIVAFSRLNLHALKRTVEKRTGRRCAIIYGALPPEVRVQQAALFNDPNNDYDYIVASDAIGMGLNLEIRRVIMESVTKFDGSQNRMLSYPEIKQIGGRAGRYRSAQNAADVTVSEAVKQVKEGNKVGYVTTMDRQDLRSIRRAFNSPVADLDTAYINPPAATIELFSTYFPADTPLSFILMRIKELAMVGERYQLGIGGDMLEIADIIQDIPLTIYDRITLCNVPTSVRSGKPVEVLRALARIIAENSNGDLLSIKEIPLELLDIDLKNYEKSPQEYLFELETLHVAMNQYIWLSYRYSGMFRSQPLAFHVRSLIEERLINTLDQLNFTEKELDAKRSRRRLQAASHEMARENFEDSNKSEDEIFGAELEEKLADMEEDEQVRKSGERVEESPSKLEELEAELEHTEEAEAVTPQVPASGVSN